MKAKVLLLLVPFVLGCEKSNKERKITYEEEVYDESVVTASLGFGLLSEYGFFEGELRNLDPAKNVFPYELNSPLFSDYALKRRFISLPKGSEVQYHPTEALDFPVGTTLIKNFYYSDDQLSGQKGRIIETRLLIRKEDGWQALALCLE